jgi:hypothetical protein
MALKIHFQYVFNYAMILVETYKDSNELETNESEMKNQKINKIFQQTKLLLLLKQKKNTIYVKETQLP